MLFNVPQFIDKEDKIVGPITAKQLGWFLAGGAILLVIKAFFDTTTVFIAAIPVIGLSLALAYYKPNGQPLIAFIIYSIAFFFKPKMFIWKRLPEKISPVKKAVKKVEVKTRRTINEEKIKEIADLLDRRQFN